MSLVQLQPQLVIVIDELLDLNELTGWLRETQFLIFSFSENLFGMITSAFDVFFVKFFLLLKGSIHLNLFGSFSDTFFSCC